ncbi:hypothetical protein J7L68_06255 [bacterium]|nr:hypothetical protein [bacterium]
MRKSIILILFFGVYVFAQTGVQLESVRSAGMGNAEVALADEAYGAATNPAGLFLSKRMQLSAAYTKFFAGLDVGSISEGTFFFSPIPGKHYVYSLAGSYFYQDIFSQMKLSFSFGRKMMKFENVNGFLGLALTADLYRVGYNLDNATYDTLHGDDPNDPLWNNGTSKMAFSGGIDVFAKINNATVGLKLSDLNEPNIAIGDDPAGALPRRMRTGFSYIYRDFIVGAMDLDMPIRSATLQDPMKLCFGLEGQLLERKLHIRGGYDMNIGEGGKGALHLGFGFRSLAKHNFGFDYALILPQGEISGHPHHKFSLVYGFPIPPPKEIDLAVFAESLSTEPKILQPDSLGIIHSVIANLGKDDAKKFYTRTYYFDEDSNYGLIEKRKISELSGEKTLNLDFDWAPPKKGYYDVYVSVDDVSDKGKVREGTLPDVNSKNNIASFRVPAFNSPTLEKNPQLLKSVLKLSEINYIREEVPMAPFVFFDETDTIVPDRFLQSMQTVAKRLGRNPNVALILKGYVDKVTEQDKIPNLIDLANARAQSLKRYLMNLGVSERQIIVVDASKYDYTQPRAGKRNRRKTSAYENMIAQENRRVEIGTEVIDFPDSILICCVNYRIGETDIPPEGKIEIENSMKLTKNLLEQNPDVIILFHGMSSHEDSARWDRSMDRALKVRNYAGQLVSKRTANRMMVYASAPDSVDMVAIHISGDAVIYRPRGSARAAQGFQVAARERNEISLTGLRVDAGVDSYYIAIVDNDMTEFKLLASGRGYPPDKIPWDWHGNDGEPPEPNKNYYAYLYIKDNVGQILESESDPVKIKITRKEKRQELILVNFTFGGTFPQSPYLEGRMERIASDFIEKAVQRKTIFKVIVGGHTDIIGSPEANQRLSLQRAKREDRNMKNILKFLLKLRNETELNAWLGEHNVSINAKGYGYSKPYKVRIWDRGYFRDVLIGDDDYPEGRFINRRVALEYEIIKHFH